MSWTKLSDAFHDDDAILDLSHPAFRLYVCGLTAASRQLSDGLLSEGQVAALERQQRIPRKARAELVGCGLWHEHDGGYVIRNYLLFNPSREQVERARQRVAARVSRWRDAHHGNAVGNAVTVAARNAVSNAVSNAVGNGVGNGAPVPSRPVPVVNIPPSPTETAPRGAVGRVFSVWQEATGRRRAVLDAKRRRAIEAALKSHGELDASDACRGWVHDPWPERPRRNDVTLLLRDAEHIEKFRDLWRDGATRAACPPAEPMPPENPIDRRIRAMGHGRVVDIAPTRVAWGGLT